MPTCARWKPTRVLGANPFPASHGRAGAGTKTRHSGPDGSSPRVPENLQESLARMNSRGQELLLEFLNIDLDLAFTFLNTARIERTKNPDHSTAAAKKAEAALYTIRSLDVRIENRNEWEKIQSRVAKLEAELDQITSSS